MNINNLKDDQLTKFYENLSLHFEKNYSVSALKKLAEHFNNLMNNEFTDIEMQSDNYANVITYYLICES